MDLFTYLIPFPVRFSDNWILGDSHRSEERRRQTYLSERASSGTTPLTAMPDLNGIGIAKLVIFYTVLFF
jgi:hypothetical protein